MNALNAIADGQLLAWCLVLALVATCVSALWLLPLALLGRAGLKTTAWSCCWISIRSSTPPSARG